MLNIDWVGENVAKITNLPPNGHKVSTSSHPTNPRELFMVFRFVHLQSSIPPYIGPFHGEFFLALHIHPPSITPSTLPLTFLALQIQLTQITYHHPAPNLETFRFGHL